MLLNTRWRLISFLLLILIFSGNNIHAQKGSPYITNFSEFDQVDYRIWDINQSNTGEMVFTTKKGLIAFNGSKWKIHDLKTTPLVIKQNVNNELILTTPGGFGQVFLDSSGSYAYQSLLRLGNTEIFGEVVRFGNNLAFIGDSSIYTIDKNNTVKEVVASDFIYPVSGSFSFENHLHIIARNKMYVLENDSLIFKKGLVFPLNNDYVFHVESNDEFAYFANTDSKLFKYDGKKIRKIQIKDQKYLDQTILQGGAFLNDSLLGLSTINGGVLIINIETGKTAYTVNYATGLPDDEVYDIFSKGDNSLWIAHAQGISRIDLNLPVKMFNHFSGLYGNLQSFVTYKNEIYVGTSDGLFYLKKIQDFATKKVKVKVKPKTQPAKIEVKPEIDEGNNEKEGKKKRRGLRKFFSKFADKATSPSSDQEPKKLFGRKSNQSNDIYRTKTIYKLLSSRYGYAQIEKIKGKCLHLLEFNGLLMVGSNTGLYVVKDHEATWLIPNAYINQIEVSKYHRNTLLISANKGLYIAKLKGNEWDIKQHYKITDEVNSSAELDESTILLGDFGRIRVLRNLFSNATVDYYEHPDFLMENIRVRKLEDKMLLFSSSNVFEFRNNTIGLYDKLLQQNNIDFRIFIDQSDYTWINEQVWHFYKSGQKEELLGAQYLSIFDKIENIIVDAKQNLWVIDRQNNLYKIDSRNKELFVPELSLNILSIDNKQAGFIEANDIVLSYGNNAIQIDVSTPFYLKHNAIEYQFQMVGLMTEWSDWTQESKIQFPFIPPGQFELKIKSRSIMGNKSNTLSLLITVQKPFTQTTLFYVLLFIAIILLATVVIRLRTAKLKRDKKILEQKVQERTKTISEQKEEIEVQRDSLAEQNEEILQQKEEITAQRDEIETQKNQIEEQHSDIKKSITYAKRIQSAILQKESTIKRWLPEYFIFWKPRDIVSGDFYWINKIDNKVVVIAADCTGHGVPGAFMSMLGVSFLNEITAHKENIEAHIILNKLRDYVKTTLSQEGAEGESKDGMDMSLMVFDFDKNMAEFAGAFNDMYMIRDNELIEVKADKMPVGIYMKEADSFTKHEISLQKGDMFYMFSDGFPDQFGGERNRKFMVKPFKRMLLEMHTMSMEDQKARLEKTLKDWIGTEYHQTDDIIIVGVKVS